ncbi:hypothetical protein [Halorhabdus sp. BNX81]|uniref:hypothetical protein n=1 Tax=Halorhabdus sp. BNX81 TaxID=2980181 RepID=UPI0023DD418E|nr:hypothetical protein [Halorhabdus sp. BNX81]WEL20399.1 hypothetical protein HBNXHr_0323 [Halorhabdus sp. BNX81]
MERSEQVLLLGFYHPRYLTPLRSWADRLRAVGCTVTEGYPDTWYAEDALDALGRRRDLVVYFGHGEPGAWTGLGRINADDVTSVEGKPHRVVVSCCCSAFEGDGDGNGSDEGKRSIATAFLDGGLAECVVGYDGRVRYEDNRAVLDHLLEGCRTAVNDGDDGAKAIRECARREPALNVAEQTER